MKVLSLPVCVLHLAVLHLILWTPAGASVLPRPNCKTEKATTQILSPGSKNYSDEAVTSSELPKQIPPPPTPTKSNFVTPHYEVQWDSGEGRRRGSSSLPVPYNTLESGLSLQKIF